MSEERAENTAGPRARQADGWVLGLDLPPKMLVSQWSDGNRMIASGTGPEPGRWRTDRTPYMREPMDVTCDPDVDVIVLEWSSQVGKTELLINVCGYHVEHDPAPMLFVMPTLELAAGFSTKRFTPTVEASPALLARMGATERRKSSTTILEKSFPGGDLVFAGANSPASLASRPRRVVLFDEVDKYKANIGHDGSPIKQGFQRTQNFWNAKKVLASTPTLEGLSEIDDWFKKSDQRHYEVPCHSCGDFHALEWENVHWPGKETPQAQPDKAWYACPSCGIEWDQRQLSLAVRHGHWKARQPFNGIAGFHIWAIYSPWVTMAELAAEWEDAFGKPQDEQAFVNLKLGRVFSPTAQARTTPQHLFERREDYGPEKLPHEVLLVTAYVDVQSDRWECQYLGWALHDEKWVVDYRVHWGNPADPNAWEAMDEALLRRDFTHASGQTLQIEAIGVDAGHLQQHVLDFCRTRRAAFRPFYAVKGVGGFGRPLWRESEERFKFGAKLYLSGVDDGKTVAYQDLATGPTPDNEHIRHRVHFPRHLDMEYFEQLVAERIKIAYQAGRATRSWVAIRKRNEALDTFVGCMAVRHTLSIDYEARRAAMTGASQAPDYSKIAALFKK